MSKRKAIIMNTTSVNDDLSTRTSLGTRIAIAAMVTLFFVSSWFASAG